MTPEPTKKVKPEGPLRGEYQCSGCRAAFTKPITSKRRHCIVCKREQNRVRLMIRGAEFRAKKSGVPCFFTDDMVSHVKTAVANGVCEVTGIDFSYDGSMSRSPTIDRIEPSLGYVSGNIRVVCFWYNSAKGRCTDEEIQGLFKTTIENVQKCNS